MRLIFFLAEANQSDACHASVHHFCDNYNNHNNEQILLDWGKNGKRHLKIGEIKNCVKLAKLKGQKSWLQGQIFHKYQELISQHSNKI